MVGNIIALILFILFAGFIAYDMFLKKKKHSDSGLPNILEPEAPKKLKGVSFQYVPWKWDWKPFVDLLAEYKVNHTRVFAVGHYAPDWVEDKADWYPWKGGWDDPIDNLDPDKVKQITDFLRYCASKGIWVHIDLWTAQYSQILDKWMRGGGDKEQVKRYMTALIKACKDAVNDRVIIGLGNEVGDVEPYNNLQRELYDEVVTNPDYVPTKTWVSAYSSHDRPWTYVTMHELCDEHHCHAGVTSNDGPGIIKYLFNRHHIYKNIMTNVMNCNKSDAPYEGFEWLTYWGKNGKCDTPEKLKSEYGDIFEHIKGLQ